MDYLDQLSQIIDLSKSQLPLTLEIIGLLWAVQILNVLVGYRLNVFGIWPRQARGLLGVFLSPLLHGSFEHLFFNSIPLLILVNLLLLYGLKFFLLITLFIAFVSGISTWFLGRPGVHVGASGVLMGYWGFFLAQAYFEPSVVTIIVAALCLYYLGSLWLNLLPGGKGVSWEGHMFGCLAGIVGAFALHVLS